MRTRTASCPLASGFTLLETVVFLVVISVALAVFARVFTQSIGQQREPLAQVNVLQVAEAAMENAIAAGVETTPSAKYSYALPVTVEVDNAGAELGVAAPALRRITVSVTRADGGVFSLSRYIRAQRPAAPEAPQ